MSERRKFLRAREVAEIRGVSVRTVRRWIAARAIPSEKIGGMRQIPVSAVEETPDLSFLEEVDGHNDGV